MVRARHRRRRRQGIEPWQASRSRSSASRSAASRCCGTSTSRSNEGEFVVLLGPSGCGKSTLLNAIAGLLDINAGQVWIGGKNVTWEEPKDRGIGMVFQSYALYPRMTAEGNLTFGLRVARVPKPEIARRVARAAELLQIEPLLQPPALGALRRPAPARRDRPGAGARRRRLPVRRAALQPRRQAEDRAAGRTEEAAHAARLDHDLRHPRPDRGADARRPRRRHASAASSSSSRRRKEIYQRPVNRFVAGFVGSPAMNFVSGKLDVANGSAAGRLRRRRQRSTLTATSSRRGRSRASRWCSASGPSRSTSTRSLPTPSRFPSS